MPVRTDLLNMGIYANFATRNEHVPEIERQHRVIKERARAFRSTLPFEVFPRLLPVKMVNNCALWINMFPDKGGISNVSPSTLLTGMPPLAGNMFIHSAQLFTILTSSSHGNTSNSKLERHARALSLMTRYWRSISGTCSFRVPKLA